MATKQVSRIKQFWHLYPAMAASVGITVVGTGITIGVLAYLRSRGDKQYMYRTRYTVIRPSDCHEEKKDWGYYN